MRKIIIGSVLLLATIGLVFLGLGWWRSHHTVHPPPVNTVEYESNMTEALVRGILDKLESNAPRTCFLAFGDGLTPPSRNFLARFQGARLNVRSCHYAVNPSSGKYYDIITGQEGLMLHVIKIKEYISGTFDVVVSLSNLPAGHDHFRYRILNIGGEWKTESCKPA